MCHYSRPKSVPSSPMVKRAFSRLGTITAGWGRSIRKQHSQLNADDKKKWASSQDCSSKCRNIAQSRFFVFRLIFLKNGTLIYFYSNIYRTQIAQDKSYMYLIDVRWRSVFQKSGFSRNTWVRLCCVTKLLR